MPVKREHGIVLLEGATSPGELWRKRQLLIEAWVGVG